jgi:alanyl-tRNA synthetase
MDIRTVVVDGIDVQACAGTHCNQTGDIGLIKITKTERIQDGVERIEFSAGEAAIAAAQNNDNLLKESSDVFKVTPEQLPKTCDRFFNEWKSFKNEIDKLKGQIASLKTEGILNKTEKIGDLIVLSEIIDSDMNELIKMATDLTEKQGKVDVVVLGSSEGKIVGSVSKKALENGIKINGIIKDAAAVLLHEAQLHDGAADPATPAPLVRERALELHRVDAAALHEHLAEPEPRHPVLPDVPHPGS